MWSPCLFHLLLHHQLQLWHPTVGGTRCLFCHRFISENNVFFLMSRTHHDSEESLFFLGFSWYSMLPCVSSQMNAKRYDQGIKFSLYCKIFKQTLTFTLFENTLIQTFTILSWILIETNIHCSCWPGTECCTKANDKEGGIWDYSIQVMQWEYVVVHEFICLFLVSIFCFLLLHFLPSAQWAVPIIYGEEKKPV